MTAPARVSQADVDRVVKVMAEREARAYRMIVDLRNERIEVIVGESATGPAAPENPWDKE